MNHLRDCSLRSLLAAFGTGLLVLAAAALCCSHCLAAPDWIAQSELVSDADGKQLQGRIYQVSGDTLIIDDMTYKASKDLVVYGKKDSLISLSSLKEGDFVTFVLDEDGEVVLLKKLGHTEDTADRTVP